MKCRQVRRKYRKYLYGQLPEDEYDRIMDHIHSCPDCATETNSLKEMRLLLQSANRVDRPDAYWDTYRERLESKLPEKPLEFTFKARISSATKNILHRPVLLGQIAVYILILAFIIYMVPNRLSKETPEKQLSTYTASEKPSTLDEARSKPESAITAGRKLDEKTAGQDIKKGISENPFKSGLGKEKDQLRIGANRPLAAAKPANVEEKRAETELAMSKDEPAPPPKSVLYDKVNLAALAQDQYTIGEQHFQNREYAQAIPAFQNFVTANSADPRALKAQYQIGESYFQMKDYPEAISNFVIVTEDEKINETASEKAESPKEGVSDASASPKDDNEQLAYRARRPETNARTAPVLMQRASDRKNIADNRESLIARAIFRQGEAYENLEKQKEALEKYREYIQKYPEGEYIKQAKEKIAELSKINSSKD